jgi:hypothetical protein
LVRAPSGRYPGRRDSVERFGPDDFFALKKGLEPRFAELTVVQVLALLRLGHDDPRLFQQCAEALARGLEGISSAEARELSHALARVAERYFHIGDADDLLLRLGLLLVRLGRPVEAVAQLERALAWHGFNVDIALTLAQLHHHLHHSSEARRYVDAVLEVAPGSSAARALRLELDGIGVAGEDACLARKASGARHDSRLALASAATLPPNAGWRRVTG